MFRTLISLFHSPAPQAPGAAVPEGERVYAIGDIHGRLDLFLELIRAVEEDDAAGERARTTFVLLGDLIDRGPDSAGVIRAARDWGRRRNVRILCGNHEEMLLLALEKEDALRPFLRHGGRETVLSYPVTPQAYAQASWDELRALMKSAIPADDISFIRGFEQSIRIGDYLFVHAGIMPGVPLGAQRESDFRWIREPFLSHTGDHGCVVVHGHTVTEDVALRPNRIGIDTGAYASGRLTALALEGTGRRIVETRVEDGTVTTLARALS